MDGYLGLPTQGATTITSALVDKSSGPFDAGLLVINDISAQDSLPAPSDKARAFLTGQVRRWVETMLPIRIVTVLAETEAALPHDSQKRRQLVQERAVPYLWLALFSSAESEVPTYLGLGGSPEQGGGGPTCPASRRIIMPWLNWPLWMSRRDNSSLAQTAPIHPPEDQAKDVLRSIDGDEALDRASCIYNNYGPSAARPSRQ